MRFPNKVISLKESYFGKFGILLDTVSSGDISPLELYEKLKDDFEDLSDYIETLVCLFALKRISLNSKIRRLTYVR